MNPRRKLIWWNRLGFAFVVLGIFFLMVWL